MIAEWNVRGCAPACHLCQTPFADRQGLHSRLMFSQDGYARQDFCADCWPRRADDPATSLVDTEVSDWNATYHAPAPRPEEALRKETAEDLLRQLMETDDPANAAPMFILAVMLERRRIFVEKQVTLQPDGRRIRLYEHKKTGETFVVPDPDLKLSELEPIQEQVMALLEGKKPGEAAAGEGAAATAEAAAEAGNEAGNEAGHDGPAPQEK